MNNEKGIKTEKTKQETMSRKDAIRKGGYITLSAATMMLLLSKPDKAVASSPAPMPDDNWP